MTAKAPLDFALGPRRQFAQIETKGSEPGAACFRGQSFAVLEWSFFRLTVNRKKLGVFGC